MKKGIGVVLATLVIWSCTNKDAEYNNEAYLIHSSTQNIFTQLGERLSIDSLKNDSAISFISYAENLCDSQLIALKALKVPTNAAAVHASLEKLILQQKTHLAIQKRLYIDNAPGEDFSMLSDSLDMNQVIIDSLLAQTKEKQILFAKANGFKLQ